MPPKKTKPIEDQENTMHSHYFKVLEESFQKYGKQTVVFYQCGSFFELYNLQDKTNGQNHFRIVEEFCQLTGMTLSCSKKTEWNDKYIVLAGFPEHSCEKFVKLAVNNEYTVVIYIQCKNPIQKQREFYMAYSPGTYISYDTEQNQQLSNNIMCIWIETYKPFHSNQVQFVCGISSVHIFTGETTIFQYDNPFYMNPTSFDELERAVSSISPSEVIIISKMSEQYTKQITQYSGINNRKMHYVYINENENQIVENCQKQTYISQMMSTFFGPDAYETCSEFYQYTIATQSFCYLIHFLQEHNQDLVHKIAFPKFNNTSSRMILANHTLKQLNIIDDDSIDGRNSGKFSSVLSFLNKCCSPMGKRLFQYQLTNPTFDTEWLQKEYNITDYVIRENINDKCELRSQLRKIKDLDKICRQIVIKKIYPKSLFSLYESIKLISEINCTISEYSELTTYLCEHNETDESITSILDSFLQYMDSVFYIDRCKDIETMTSFSENIIKESISPELDQISKQYKSYQTLFDQIKNVLNDLMCNYEEMPDGDYIKIHSTEKSGNTLQITHKRGITLKKIFEQIHVLDISPELKLFTKDIQIIKAGASNDEIDFPQLTTLLKQIAIYKEKLSNEISKIYLDILRTLEKDWYQKLEQIILYISRLDVIHCKAYTAVQYNYCKPTIDNTSVNGSFFEAKDIRHILIEHLQQNEIYITNDLTLGNRDKKHGILLFGTNAVGKTSFIRAIGIIIIMAQSGLYVPCSEFNYQPYKSIFSRILGNDNLFKGLSTFAVEMSELRVILKMADESSLVLGDELCSGTEIESALSLFCTGLIDLHEKKSTFLFATHFHEITKYEEIQNLNGLELKHMAVHYDIVNQCLVYDRKLMDGQGSRTYGLEVCKSLHMEESFLENAYNFRRKYFPESSGSLQHSTSRYNSNKIKGFCEKCKKVLADETHHLSPQRNADENGFIGSFHKDHKANLLALCEKCHDEIHREDSQYTIKKTTKGFIPMKM